MPSFTLDRATARRLATLARERGITLTALVRYALAEYDTLPATSTRGVEHSVRLDPEESAKLAKRAKVSRSRALAALLERTLDDLGSKPSSAPPPPTSAEPVAAAKAPGPRAYKQWARLILDCAQSAERRAPGDRKVWLGSMLDCVVARVQPEKPEELREQVRAMLPELNRRDLLAMHRCDLTPVYPAHLVQTSAVHDPATFATWHFLELPE